MAPLDRKEQARLRAIERTRAWRQANPEWVKRLSTSSRTKRKKRWVEFLTQERERYHQNPHKKLTRQRLFRVANQASVAAGMHRHYVQNKARYAAKVAARRAARINATPSWCDKAAIVELYREARRLTVETGIRHEVDHIVPLVGRNVCGLHIPQNMRVITRLENRRKFNRLIDAGGPHENPSEHRISG